MKPALYTGTISHRRNIPKIHAFRYPFFMWFLNLDTIDTLEDQGRWFSTHRFALSRFHRPDYYGDPEVPLHRAIKIRMAELTGIEVEGSVCGLLNLRTLGLYFSPVNFYFGYGADNELTHFLAEVSNIPWNQRHQYAYHMPHDGLEPTQPKQFHVSPFNGLDQTYRWQITPPGEQIRITLHVDDDRGHVFTAALTLDRHPLKRSVIRNQLVKKPIMTASIVTGIYWQALKLFLKGVPYVPYHKEVS